MPRLSVSCPYDTGPTKCTATVLLPPSRIVLGSMVISRPSTSENVAPHSRSEIPSTFTSTRNRKVVKGRAPGSTRSSATSALLDGQHRAAFLHQPDRQEHERLGRRDPQLDDEAALIDALRRV